MHLKNRTNYIVLLNFLYIYIYIYGISKTDIMHEYNNLYQNSTLEYVTHGNQTVWAMVKALDFYSGDPWFKYQPGHHLT